MINALLVAIVVLQSITLVVLVVAVVFYMRRTNEAAQAFGQSTKDLRDGILPAVVELRQTIKNTDDLVLAARAEVESIGRLTGSVERLVNAVRFFQVAEKAVTSSRTTVVSVLDGIKAGLTALKSAKSNSEEATKHVER